MSFVEFRTFRGRGRPGFTLIELILFAMIASLLTAIALPAFSRLREQRAAMNARDAYVWAAAVARALAIERGRVVTFELSPADGAAVIRVGSDTIQRVDFVATYGASVSASGAVTVCYLPRGFALQTSCSQGLPADIVFTRGPHEARVRVRALGQVEPT